ncbi:CHAT domain-containing protein [Erythrobacter crassostreae]|uniref:CHAT domain-containing protein n=1 Tax=Erythrobacter crassostreae TaxID=2828328 RepID=A0A9X1F1M4_9SPHN|nr:CHAT domain-containing protein [Erythrobacter crassostrea]MBV7258660.1 hypothetical protein [Erythrobacter crassostrea]
MTINDLSTLIIMSSPEGAERLRVDVEARVLEAIADKSARTISPFKIIHAARPKDVFEALSAKPYSCVQFSGHGSPSSVFLEDNETASGTAIGLDVLERILIAAQPHLSVVVFMSCYSAEMADSLIQSVPIIISCDGPADDSECVSFLERFYTALFNSNDVESSFQRAQAATYAGKIQPILQRRSNLSENNPSLIRVDSRMGYVLYVDVSNVQDQAQEFGMSTDELLRLVARKIRYHRWAFRYPRDRALFPVGHLFGHFSWTNAQDVVRCDQLYSLSSEVEDDACAAWIELMMRYHDCYVADYRSPTQDMRLNERSSLDDAIATIERLNANFFYGAYFALMCDYAPESARMARSICLTSIKIAREKLIINDTAGSIQNLEAALSAIHDLIEGFGRKVLK